MHPGDIFFSKPVSLSGYVNITAQNIRALFLAPRHGLMFGKFSHAAVCIIGPLVIEALKGKGAVTSIYDEQAKANTVYDGFRFRAGIDQELLNSVVIYFLREKYQLKGVSIEEDGASFCALLVQKIFAKMNIAPFNTISRNLTPIELYHTLANAPDWERIKLPFVEGYSARVAELLPSERYKTEVDYVNWQLTACKDFQQFIDTQVRFSDDAVSFVQIYNSMSQVDDALHSVFMSENIPTDLKIKWLSAGASATHWHESHDRGPTSYRRLLEYLDSTPHQELAKQTGRTVQSNFLNNKPDLPGRLEVIASNNVRFVIQFTEVDAQWDIIFDRYITRISERLNSGGQPVELISGFSHFLRSQKLFSQSDIQAIADTIATDLATIEGRQEEAAAILRKHLIARKLTLRRAATFIADYELDIFNPGWEKLFTKLIELRKDETEPS
jgi:hypothetical protein